MQEILKNIYNQHGIKRQREMIQKTIEHEKYLMRNPRRKYEFKKEANIRNSSNNFTIDDQIKFQKQLNSKSYRNQYPQSKMDFIPLEVGLKFPKIKKSQNSSHYIKKFKAAVRAVIFLRRLKQKFQNSLVKLKEKAQKSSMKLLKNIDILVKEYYQDLLKNQLEAYAKLLQKFIQDQKQIDNEKIIELLINISQKLSNSTVTQNILDFFIFIATNKGFPPSDYLSFLEIVRVQFSPKYGCLMNVSNEQTRMLIALGLGIKIFCYYVLCQPFDPQKNVKIDQKLINVIQNITSIFYYILLNEFCLNISQIKTKNLKILQKFKISIIKPLNPLKLTPSPKKDQDILIFNMTSAYFDKLQSKSSEKLKRIKFNVEKWINRISFVCLKQAGSIKNLKMKSTDASNVMSRNCKNSFRRAYKSLELKQQQKQQQVDYIIKKAKKVNMRYLLQ